MTTFILLAVAGTILSVIIGTLWYMPNTPTGRLHMRYLGFDKLSPEEQAIKVEEAKPTMPKIYGAQMLLSFITVIAVVGIVLMSMKNGVPREMAIGFVVINWFCFMVPVLGSQILWGPCEREIAWKKFWSDIFYNLAILLVVAVLASFFA
jgi:hypothetical protein